jgi:hypothetical protein
VVQKRAVKSPLELSYLKPARNQKRLTAPASESSFSSRALTKKNNNKKKTVTAQLSKQLFNVAKTGYYPTLTADTIPFPNEKDFLRKYAVLPMMDGTLGPGAQDCFFTMAGACQQYKQIPKSRRGAFPAQGSFILNAVKEKYGKGFTPRRFSASSKRYKVREPDCDYDEDVY